MYFNELLKSFQSTCIDMFKFDSDRGTCVTEDTRDKHPRSQIETGTEAQMGGLLFQPGQDGCLISPPSQALGALGSFTLALWIKPTATGEM